MKPQPPKIRSVKRRDIYALHDRMLKSGRHRNRQERRSGKRDPVDEWRDEIDPMIFKDNHPEEETQV